MKKNIQIILICLLCSISTFSQSKKEWTRVQTLDASNVYEQFIQNYPSGKYTEQAKQKLAELRAKEPVREKVEVKAVAKPEVITKEPVQVETAKAENKSGSYFPEINRLQNGISVPRGKMTLKDGTSVKFRNLRLQNSVFNYIDSNGNTTEKSPSEVFKVTKNGTFAGYGALTGGLSGLLACLQFSASESQNDINYGYYGYEKRELSGSDYLLITTIGVGIGGLIGMLFKKETTVFKNNAALSFYTSINSSLPGNYCPMISLNINLKQ